MKLRYKIDDLNCCEFVVDFEFSRHGDHVEYDSAFDIVSIQDVDFNHWPVQPFDYDHVLKWLSNGGEERILAEARSHFVLA